MANKNIKINLDYSNFVGGMKECQSKMQILNNEFKLQTARMGETASTTDKLSLKEEILSQKVSLQQQIVDQAVTKWEAMADSEDATVQQVEAAHRAFQKQATILAEMRNELNSTRDELRNVSEAEDEVTTSSDTGSGSFETYASSITSAIAQISNMVAILGQVGDMIMDVATKSTEWADDLMTLSAQIGVSTTTLQEWSYASDYVDVSVETLQGSLTKLTKNMGEVANGSDSAKAKFAELGVEVTTSNGQLKSSEQVFYECIDALGRIENQAERDSAAMSIFGKSATELNTLIEAGSGALASYGEQAQELGLVMSEYDVQALASMNDSFDRLNSVMDGAQNRLSAAFAPAIAAVADAISEMNPEVLTVIAGFGAVLGLATKIAPMLTSMATMYTMLTVAKTGATAATVAETAAETGLGAAALATDAALLPQIAMAVALMAALAGLIYIIKTLIELFNDEADAANNAASATQKFTSASSGQKVSGTTGSASKSEHHATGGWTRSNQVWVGEQGAELVDLPVGSYVHNSTDSRNMSSTSNVFNVTIDAKNVDDFNKVVNVFNGLSQSMSRGNRVNG